MEGQPGRPFSLEKRRLKNGNPFLNEGNFLSRGGAEVCQPGSATFNLITDLLEHIYPSQFSMTILPMIFDGYQLFFQWPLAWMPP